MRACVYVSVRVCRMVHNLLVNYLYDGNVYACAGCPEEERAATTSVIISQY